MNHRPIALPAAPPRRRLRDLPARRSLRRLLRAWPRATTFARCSSASCNLWSRLAGAHAGAVRVLSRRSGSAARSWSSRSRPPHGRPCASDELAVVSRLRGICGERGGRQARSCGPRISRHLRRSLSGDALLRARVPAHARRATCSTASRVLGCVQPVLRRAMRRCHVPQVMSMLQGSIGELLGLALNNARLEAQEQLHARPFCRSARPWRPRCTIRWPRRIAFVKMRHAVAARCPCVRAISDEQCAASTLPMMCVAVGDPGARQPARASSRICAHPRGSREGLMPTRCTSWCRSASAGQGASLELELSSSDVPNVQPACQ